jgi:hypothetical protein
MKAKFTLLCVAMLAGTPAFAQGLFKPDGVQPIDPKGDGGPQQIQLPPDPEGKAVELRLHGRCNEAIPILRNLTAINQNDEIAKFNLGQCLVDASKSDTDKSRASHDAYEGVQWMMEAANHGLPNAQEGLISVFLDGLGVARNPVEAGKWSLIYHSNGTRFALGMHDIPDELQARLDQALNEQTWDEAQAEADQWSPQTAAVDE